MKGILTARTKCLWRPGERTGCGANDSGAENSPAKGKEMATRAFASMYDYRRCGAPSRRRATNRDKYGKGVRGYEKLYLHAQHLKRGDALMVALPRAHEMALSAMSSRITCLDDPQCGQSGMNHPCASASGVSCMVPGLADCSSCVFIRPPIRLSGSSSTSRTS